MRALIFDFDGLILDTETPEYQAWQEVYAEHGLTLPLSVWIARIGHPSTSSPFDPYDHLEAQFGRPVDRELIRSARQRRKSELLLPQPPLPGVREYIEDAKRLGLKLGVAPGSASTWVEPHLVRLGLREHFDCVRCGDQVQCTKPDPEVYRSVLEELDASADEAIALEDSPVGGQAAKAAGVYCVAVPNQMTRQLSFEHADLVLGSLLEMPLERLISAVWSEDGRSRSQST